MRRMLASVCTAVWQVPEYYNVLLGKLVVEQKIIWGQVIHVIPCCPICGSQQAVD
jgi:hypothetical protein